MDERNLGGKPENIEAESISQTLRKIAREFSFVESPELQEIQRRAVERSKSLDSPEAMKEFRNLIAQIQILGEDIVNQVENQRFGLAQVGLIITRAATLFESDQLEDFQDEINDALTVLYDEVTDHPEISSIIQKLEKLKKVS